MRFPISLRRAGRVVVAAALSCAAARPAAAQNPPAGGQNNGALTFAGGVDAPTLFVYRGIAQEGDAKLTLTPYGDLGIRLKSGAKGDRLRINVGLWNSLNTGSSGTGGPTKALHYAEQFYATLAIGLAKGITLTPGYLANTSANRSYDTIREVNVRLALAGRLAPYGLVAFEISDTGQADGGSKRGTYFEAGAGPSFGVPWLKGRLTVPVKAGVSLGHYYELFGSDLKYRDHPFGFFDAGGLVTVPLTSVAPRFGSWNIRGGASVLVLGDTTRAFNLGSRTKIVALAGIGLSY